MECALALVHAGGGTRASPKHRPFLIGLEKEREIYENRLRGIRLQNKFRHKSAKAWILGQQVSCQFALLCQRQYQTCKQAILEQKHSEVQLRVCGRHSYQSLYRNFDCFVGKESEQQHYLPRLVVSYFRNRQRRPGSHRSEYRPYDRVDEQVFRIAVAGWIAPKGVNPDIKLTLLLHKQGCSLYMMDSGLIPIRRGNKRAWTSQLYPFVICCSWIGSISCSSQQCEIKVASYMVMYVNPHYYQSTNARAAKGYNSSRVFLTEIIAMIWY